MTSKRREDANKTKAERQFDPNNHDDEGDGDATQKTTTTEEGDHHDDNDGDETQTKTTTEEAGQGKCSYLEPRHGRHENSHT